MKKQEKLIEQLLEELKSSVGKENFWDIYTEALDRAPYKPGYSGSLNKLAPSDK